MPLIYLDINKKNEKTKNHYQYQFLVFLFFYKNFKLFF